MKLFYDGHKDTKARFIHAYLPAFVAHFNCFLLTSCIYHNSQYLPKEFNFPEKTHNIPMPSTTCPLLVSRLASVFRIKPLMLLPALLWAFCAISQPNKPAFPLKVTANGQHLVDEQNRPFFYNAETP
jgi:hypothetical protein